MKTLVTYTAAALLLGLFAYAAEPATTPPPAACTYMSNPTLGSAKGPQWIRCTAETMRTDVRCRNLCEATAK